MIEFYNQTKGGVNTLDQMSSLTSCSRKTRRWPLCNFYGILNIVLINSYVTQPLSRRQYLEKLHQELVESHMQKRVIVPTLGTDWRDSITQILNMAGNSGSNSFTLQNEERSAASIPAQKKEENMCHMSLRKANDDKK